MLGIRQLTKLEEDNLFRVKMTIIESFIPGNFTVPHSFEITKIEMISDSAEDAETPFRPLNAEIISIPAAKLLKKFRSFARK